MSEARHLLSLNRGSGALGTETVAFRRLVYKQSEDCAEQGQCYTDHRGKQNRQHAETNEAHQSVKD